MLEFITDINQFKFVTFETTPSLPTYVYAIVVGPYKFYEAAEEDGMPPMRIYARPSLIEEVPHEEMFKVTKAGIKFYSELFGQKYPFGKYDQVFVPEAIYGAMENVGCVTYAEFNIYSGDYKSMAKRLRTQIRNLHELCHMWFGNMVTMKWWNDLWLNEAFASYMSFLSMSSIPELAYFDTVWITFLEYKQYGIGADELTSTHPVCCEINETIEA